MSSIQEIPLNRIDGSAASLKDFSGQVVLIVNVASKCGLTPQYAALEALYQAKYDLGLTILGFPANNFKEQEPGSNAEIAEFCSLNYGVSFPLFEKLSVKGDDRHPLYAELTAAQPTAVDVSDGAFREKLASRGLASAAETPDILWNFEKFLLSRDGRVVARFSPATTPDDPALTAAVDP